MDILQKHTLSKGKDTYHYLFFDNVTAFNVFVDTQVKQLSKTNHSRWQNIQKSTVYQIKKATDWYGLPKVEDISELEMHHSFLGMPLLEKIQPQIKEKLNAYLQYLDHQVLPKPKMDYNDRGLGVFSFDRAAMAMYKQYPINTHTPIDTSMSQMHIELKKYHLQTTVKSVYAYFKNKNTSYPSLQLYIMAGANAKIQGDALLYVGLACSELTAFMEARGISVEVNILLGTSFKDNIVMGCVRVKRYQDTLDKNQLLLLSSDPRYFRYRGFKALITLSNYFNLTIPEGLGSLSKEMGTAFVSLINPKGFVFEQSYAMDTAVKEVSSIIKNYKKRYED